MSASAICNQLRKKETSNFLFADNPAQNSQLLTRGLGRPLEKRPLLRDGLEFSRVAYTWDGH